MKNVNFDQRECEIRAAVIEGKVPAATRFYVISSKDMQINVLINNRLERAEPATGPRIMRRRFLMS